MADFTPVALGIKPPQGMTLGEMLNIANSAQQYRQAQQINPLQVQKAQEEVKQSQFATSNAQLENMLKHTSNTVQGLQSLMGDKDLNADKIKEFASKYVANAESPETALKQVLMGLPEKGSQSELRAFLAKKLAMAAGTQVQLEKMYPSAQMLNTGNQQVPIQMGNQALTGVTPGTLQGLGIQSQLGPSQLMEPTGRTDPAGNPTAYVKDSSGNILGEVIIPAGVQQPQGAGQPRIPQGGGQLQAGNPAAPSNAPLRMPFENADTVAAARNIQLNANKAATGVQTSQFNTNTIINLADKALVGSNAETLAKLGGGFAAVPWSSDATDNRQKLGHQIALETANLAAGAGLNTDAARSLGEKMSGTTDWTPEAIKSTARMNRALTTGTDMFNRGVNAAVQAAGNNPIAARDFQNKWSTQEQLVPTLQFIDALRNAQADPVGAQKAIQSVGGYGSDGYKDMLKRAGKLNELITKGQ